MDFGITAAFIVMGLLGLVFGVGLAVASSIFAVKKDPRVDEIDEILPGANCGACGAPGCSGFAEGVVEGKYPVSACVVGGPEVAKKIAEILGTESGEIVPKVAVVRCRGTKENCPDKAIYQGIKDCAAAQFVDNGAKGCTYGCLGLGTCVDACPFDAMYMGEEGLPVVIEDKCTGCGKCTEVCPRNIMELIPRSQKVYIACVSKDFGKDVKQVCKVGCIGCKMCSRDKITPGEIITMDGNLPVIHYDRINHPVKDLETAVEKCPSKCFAVRDTETAGVEEPAAEKEQA